jgi:transposase
VALAGIDRYLVVVLSVAAHEVFAIRSCGFAHENNRRSKHQFVCQKCEYELNADYNASKNIARKLLNRLHSGQTSSGGGAPCQCALASGTLNLNGEYTASVTATAEGESTDKPTTSVVGR